MIHDHIALPVNELYYFVGMEMTINFLWGIMCIKKSTSAYIYFLLYIPKGTCGVGITVVAAALSELHWWPLDGPIYPNQFLSIQRW